MTTTIEVDEEASSSVVVLPFARRCDQCNEEVAEQARYCGSCGGLVHDSARSDTTPLGGFDLAVGARARLAVLNGDGSLRRAVPLYGDGCVVGSAEAQLTLERDPFVSPHHCRISRRDGGWAVEDLGSVNGVFQRLRAAGSVQPGAFIRVGAQLFKVSSHDDLFGRQPPPLPPSSAVFFGSPSECEHRLYLCQLLASRRVGAISSLTPSEPFVVGRTTGDWSFSSDDFMSSRHASFTALSDGTCEVKDLGSRNGVFVRLRGPTQLEPGALLLIGETVLKFELS